MESPNNDNQPVYKDRRGRMKLVIWQNETSSGPRYSSEIYRTWKDGEEFQTTYRIDEGDLLSAAKLAHIADDWIARQRLADAASADIE